MNSSTRPSELKCSISRPDLWSQWNRGFWTESTEGCCQVEPEWNSSGMSFPDEETYLMKDEDNKD